MDVKHALFGLWDLLGFLWFNCAVHFISCCLCVLVLLGSVVCYGGEGLKSLDVCCWINGSCFVLSLVEDDHTGCDWCCGAHHHHYHHPHTGSMITSVAAHELLQLIISSSPFHPPCFSLEVHQDESSAPCTCGPSLHQHKPMGIYSAGTVVMVKETRFFCKDVMGNV